MKDGINNCIVHGRKEAVNPENKGTKVSADYEFAVGAGELKAIRLRLATTTPGAASRVAQALGGFDSVFKARQLEADEFYNTVIPSLLNADEANVMRQALAGMLWSKQVYYYDVDKWLEEHGSGPFNPGRRPPRNEQWHHMFCQDIISMPDKWEYPWFAAWDLAFHVLALTLADEQFGKDQLELMLLGDYLHPNGQLPAYDLFATTTPEQGMALGKKAGLTETQLRAGT